ncbi:DNA alkylation repair protein [Rathayibacter sp. VKM Ac-2754]|uniref:DNA alkylation repair protein n=1 Tax=Rathayibacter sp. VKM Ac-2754 TaxID=2609251 RepID=UPI001357B5C7|nr:DNA alkylation repair protein [Rathayibacter sp. VKM Ac-2754]MWV57828.1 DNA alkylation repair protein [Rathayibacter sp. VKM Ac-2754]
MPFADQLIDSGTADDLAAAVALVSPPGAPALAAAGARLAGLALRERADLLRDALLADVPGSYADLASVVRAARSATPTFRGWMIWPVTAAVASRGVADDSFDDALALLAELTGLLTSEFAIRTLLRHDLDRALGTIATWTASSDEHVRRLASEGTRPYLPWSVRVPELTGRPGVTVPILDGLYRDESEYVRRSVANHLNDLSRDAPELVTATAARWLADPDEHTARVVRHGLRTLVKRGDPGALALLGFASAGDALEIDGPHLDRTVVAMGESVEFRASLRNTGVADLRLAVDYVVHHRKASGGQTSKTFKLTTASVRPGEMLEVRRAHSFRAITTRRYYAGLHAIALQINGVETERAVFELVGA